MLYYCELAWWYGGKVVRNRNLHFPYIEIHTYNFSPTTLPLLLLIVVRYGGKVVRDGGLLLV